MIIRYLDPHGKGSSLLPTFMPSFEALEHMH